jgi:hypothetical protein
VPLLESGETPPNDLDAVTQIAARLHSQFAAQGRQVVSIVGSGGKTTLLWALARALVSPEARVLVSTTTKIWPPKADELLPGVTVAGTVNAVTGKLEAPPLNELRVLCACFDYVLLEADGAAGKPLKAWAAYEPVVPDYTTMTIAVLPLCAGMIIGLDAVHRLPLFNLAYGDVCAGKLVATTVASVQGEAVTASHLARIIQGGLLYRTYGARVLVMH